MEQNHHPPGQDRFEPMGPFYEIANLRNSHPNCSPTKLDVYLISVHSKRVHNEILSHTELLIEFCIRNRAV